MTAPDAEQIALQAAAEPPLRGQKMLSTLGTALGFGAVLLFLNVGSLPVHLSLGQLIVTFVAIGVTLEAVRWVRRGIRRQARSQAAKKIAEYGGGLYGTAAFATWAYLQATDLFGEVVEAGSIGAWVSSISVGWLISEAVEAVMFGLQALVWPWHWFSAWGFNTALAVGIGVCAIDAAARPSWRWVAGRRTDGVAPEPDVAAAHPPTTGG